MPTESFTRADTVPADPPPLHATTDLVQAAWPQRVFWTEQTFSVDNPTLRKAFAVDPEDQSKLLLVIEEAVAQAHPQLHQQIRTAFSQPHLPAPTQTLTLPGAEPVKDGMTHVNTVLESIQNAGIDRRSYVLAIGGGALLDAVGFAASIAHRGVRLIRMPTTTLSQCDAGVGVKNAVNLNGEKNFIGCFQVPWAVINDAAFLTTLPIETWREGLAEAVKVAALKDAVFFETLEANAEALRRGDAAIGQAVWRRTADRHIDHIANGGDPFEQLRARPLDFGHWAAHRLEQMTDYRLSHGHAVAIGLTIDVQYAAAKGLLDQASADRVTRLIQRLGLPQWHPLLKETDRLLKGLESFRQHLGGRLTLTLIKGLGRPIDVHEIDAKALQAVIERLNCFDA